MALSVTKCAIFIGTLNQMLTECVLVPVCSSPVTFHLASKSLILLEIDRLKATNNRMEQNSSLLKS